jgi:hypothetical protein
MGRSSWNLWQGVFARSSKVRFGRDLRSRKPRSARLLVEPLESRTLLNGGSAVANNDFIDTDGTNPVVINVLANDSVPPAVQPATVLLQSLPVHGSATVGKDGSVTYKAVSGFGGTDTFTYDLQTSDGATSNAATVTVVVNRPKANDDVIDTDAGNPVTIAVLANDTDPDGPGKLNPATVAVVPGTGPSHGSTLVNADGTITYTPVDGFSGTDVFQYTVQDFPGATSNPAYVSVVVNRPQANDDFDSTNLNTAVKVNVLANDTDPDGPNKLNAATVQVLSSPANGSAQANADGTITYTPHSGFIGTDTFQYTVKDIANATSNPARVTITVINTGIVNADSIDTDAGNAVNIPVLANDSSPVGLQPSTVAVATAPGHGTAAAQSDGTINYTPAAGFAGTDTFTYTVQNTNGVTLGPATVSVIVNRPKANDDFTDTDAGNAVIVNVLANDTDPDGNNMLDPSTVHIAPNGNPHHGTASVNSDGTITYTPVDGYSGTDTLEYTVNDVNHATSNVATVTIVVNRPTANDDLIDTDGTNPVTISVLSNDTDPDGLNKLDPSTVKVVSGSGPLHGQVLVNPDGTITYTANMGFDGTDTFQYTVKDVANATSNPATVSVTVNRPTAEDDGATTFGTTPVTVNVLANDSDPDGAGKIDPGSVTVVSGPAHGSTHVNSDGSITYTPAAGFSGIDTFGYTIKDLPGATSNVATVRVDVNPPTAVPDSVSTFGTTPVVIPVLSNDSTIGGSLVPGSIVITSAPSHGSVSLNPNTGQLTYIAASGFFGTDSFGYQVSDSFGSVSNPTTVTVNVQHAPRPVVRLAGHRHGRLSITDPVTGRVVVLTPFGKNFHGVMRVAVGDINGDGRFEILAAGQGWPAVLVLDGLTGAVLGRLSVRGIAHASGVQLTSADVNHDGRDDIIVRFGPNKHPHFVALDGVSGAPIAGVTDAQLSQFFTAQG